MEKKTTKKKAVAKKAPTAKAEVKKAPAKKPVAKKAPAKNPVAKKAPAKKTSAKKAGKTKYTPEQIYSMIEQAAYFAAVSDGFQQDPAAYWLQAEAEVNAMIKG